MTVIIRLCVPDVCTLAQDRGPCKGAFRRWRFDQEKDECVQFLYGGCQGNKNNFVSKTACQEACGK